MKEIIIRSSNLVALQKLEELLSLFDFEIERREIPAEKEVALPVSYSEKPNILALAGIWKDQDISLESIRKEAWGDRI